MATLQRNLVLLIFKYGEKSAVRASLAQLSVLAGAYDGHKNALSVRTQ